MDAIRTYLESMFAQLPNTEAVKKAKAELSQMMEDKYLELCKEGKSQNEAVGTVIAEFGNLDEIADSLGIGHVVHNEQKAKERKQLTLQQVKDYLSVAGKAAHCTALGVFLCMTCVVFCIIMAAFADVGFVSSSVADALGVCFLFLFVASGVGLFIFSGNIMRPWKFLDTELCSIDVSSAEYVSAQKKAYQPTYNIALTVGVVLCILCVVPVAVVGSLNSSSDFLVTLMAALIFIISGIGVFLLVSSAKKNSSFQKLLLLNDVTTVSGSYGAEEKYNNKSVAVIMSVFWPIVTLVYFIISFATHKWQYTWLIFVVGGIVSMLIKNLCAPSEKEAAYVVNKNQSVHYTNKTVEEIMSVFWPVVTCVYLIWSFLTFDWHITWIIWPIAAIASMLVRNICGKDN